ncbi:MAG TPA: hypothetical protein DCY59_05680 [Micrococcaceae bacterium]|nr:hypothetical protein [Micrococcaceae bacterium]
MSTIRLPRVAVSRDLANKLTKDIVYSEQEPIVLDGRGLVVNNDGFAQQIAADLKSLNIDGVQVLGGSPEWQQAIREAGREHDLLIKVLKVA